MIDLEKISSKEDGEDTQWLPMSDLMSGLMMLFLFIAVSFILNTKRVAEKYDDNQQKIYQALQSEFQSNLTNWKAKIDKESLTFIFTDPEVLFQTGRADLQSKFKEILTAFFPRYMKVIDQYRDFISEVRIEGHTSSDWSRLVSADVAYFENMRLSQERTRSVLEYTYYLPEVENYRGWIKKNVSAVGLSSSKIVLNTDGSENREASKRVTFRIITNAEAQLRRLSELK
ncbi:OmpA family protein [Histophilus somni]|nr:OmpA family protein [Histophilus somni]